MKRRAIFLDRDGTVNEEVGHVTSLDLSRLLPRSARAIRRINDAGFLAIVVTNQSGVARGLFDDALVREVHDALGRRLAEEGARLDGIYVCPHHPESADPTLRDCDCRKPQPGLLLRAAREHGIDLPASYMIGDSARDMEAARRAGATGILVLTGHTRDAREGRADSAGAAPAHVASDLLEAVEWILTREGAA